MTASTKGCCIKRKRSGWRTSKNGKRLMETCEAIREKKFSTEELKDVDREVEGELLEMDLRALRETETIVDPGSGDDRDVEIIIRPKAKGQAAGVVSVSVA